MEYARSFLYLMSINFIILGSMLVIVFGIPLLYNAKASESWPATDGIITTSEVVQEKEEDGGSYSANIIYSYTLKDKKLEGNQIWFGGDFGSSYKQVFQRSVDEFPVGKKVKVHFNPFHISKSVLLPGIYLTTWFISAVGLFIAGTGGTVMFLLRYFKKNKQKKTSHLPIKQTIDGTL